MRSCRAAGVALQRAAAGGGAELEGGAGFSQGSEHKVLKSDSGSVCTLYHVTRSVLLLKTAGGLTADMECAPAAHPIVGEILGRIYRLLEVVSRF